MIKQFFNKNFSLSFDGKFLGCENDRVNTDLLFHKLSRVLRSENDCKKRPLSYPLVMRISGHVCKLYLR